MGKRQQRQEIIKEIINAHNVATQADLAALLNAAGVDCTQATVSRDIVDMRLEKDGQGFYTTQEMSRLRRITADVVISVHAAGNLVVVKTRAAGADSLADALDRAQLAGTLGTIAGEDTIFLAAETAQQALDIQDYLNSFCK